MPVKKVTVTRGGSGRKVEVPEAALKHAFPSYKPVASSKAGGTDAPSSNAKAVTAAKES